jgi:hypothetical protein
MRATSKCPGAMLRMPLTVLIVTGTITALAMISTFRPSSMPISMMKSGSQPSTGTRLMALKLGIR